MRFLVAVINKHEDITGERVVCGRLQMEGSKIGFFQRNPEETWCCNDTCL